MGTIYETLEKICKQYHGQQGIHSIGIGKDVIQINSSVTISGDLKAMIGSMAFPHKVTYVINDPPVAL